MRTSQTIDFAETTRTIGRLIFTDFQKAETALDAFKASLDSSSASGTRAIWHFLRGQFDNEKYQFEDAVAQFSTAIKLLENGGDRRLLADARLELAAVFSNLGKLEQAEETLALTRNFIKKNGDKILLARLTGREAFLKLHEGNLEPALAQLLDAQQIMAKLPDGGEPRDLAFRTRIEGGLYDIYQQNGDLESAAQATLDALKIAETNGLRARISYLYLNAGRAFNAFGDIEKAAHFYEKAAETKDDINRETRASANANFGLLLLKKGNIAQAEFRLEQAAQLWGTPKTPKDFTNLSLTEAWLAQLFLIKKMDAAAELHLNKAVELAQQGDNFGHTAELCRQTGEYFADKTDFEKAYKNLRLAEHFARVEANQSREEKLNEIKIKHDAEKRRHEAEFARTQAVSLQLRALRAQMNPHFVFNALNSVQSLLVTGKAAEAGEWLIQFSRLMRRALDLSNAETISLEEEIEFLQKYLEINQKLRFREKLTFEIIADDDLETDFIKIPTMIIQPYVENAIEHGIKPRGGGHIRIVFSENDDQTLICSVEDNGLGLREMLRRNAENPENRTHRSRGREITEERLALLHRSAGRKVGEWVRTSDLSDGPETGKTGTRVEIFIPEI